MSAPPVSLNEPLLTAAQVAVLLGVPRSSVYEYARRHHDPLPTIGIGRHRRFFAPISSAGSPASASRPTTRSIETCRVRRVRFIRGGISGFQRE